MDTYDGNNNLEREPLNYGGAARARLAATTVNVDGIEYALFAGGETLDTDAKTKVIDIYDPVSEKFLPV